MLADGLLQRKLVVLVLLDGDSGGDVAGFLSRAGSGAEKVVIPCWLRAFKHDVGDDAVCKRTVELVTGFIVYLGREFE